MRISILVCLILLISAFASAQTWEVGGFAGGSGYMGDINPLKPYKVSGMAYGGQIKRNLDGYWALKLNIAHGKIQADDAASKNAHQSERNINFFSAITEVSLQTEFNFFNYFPGSLPGNGTRRATPFLFAGIGGVLFNPKTKYGGDVYILRNYVTEGADLSERYKKNALSIPYGAGYKYNLTGNLNLIAEAGFRTAYTDFLDDVSGNYPNYLVPNFNTIDGVLSDPSRNQVGRAGAQRGDFRKRDTYFFTGLSLTYTFVSIKCPMF
ncbi:MAG: hypothetical protein H7096_00970 [Flavobacterium sp.]|nr:hypothetical protein [Pedobacter sp.]